MAGNIITGAFLTLCSYSDIKRREIYVKPALALILLGIVFAALQGRDSLLSAFLGALTGVALIIISKLTKGAVGRETAWYSWSPHSIRALRET